MLVHDLELSEDDKVELDEDRSFVGKKGGRPRLRGQPIICRSPRTSQRYITRPIELPYPKNLWLRQDGGDLRCALPPPPL